MASSAALGASTRVATGPVFPPRTPAGLLLRLRTWLRRPWLDGSIARGAGRPGDRGLALREAQLVERRQRIRLSLRFEKVLAARPGLRGLSSAAPVDICAVDGARPVLTELILSLRSSETVEARGVVLGWRLLTDPRSPIYEPPEESSDDPDRLWHASLSVLWALRPLTGDAEPAPR